MGKITEQKIRKKKKGHSGLISRFLQGLLEIVCIIFLRHDQHAVDTQGNIRPKDSVVTDECGTTGKMDASLHTSKKGQCS